VVVVMVVRNWLLGHFLAPRNPSLKSALKATPSFNDITVLAKRFS